MERISITQWTAIAATLGALLLASGCAHHHHHGQKVDGDQLRMEFKAKDQDGDRQLTWTEFATGAKGHHAKHLRKHFAQIDLNGDGLVSFSELDAAQHKPVKRRQGGG